MISPTPILRAYSLIRLLRPILPSRWLPSTSHRGLAPSDPNPLAEPRGRIPSCPPSLCACAATPPGLAIDRERQLSGTVPPYAQHVVISTGRNDWSSRIEDEPATLGPERGGDNFARTLKELVRRGGKYHDVSA